MKRIFIFIILLNTSVLYARIDNVGKYLEAGFSQNRWKETTNNKTDISQSFRITGGFELGFFVSMEIGFVNFGSVEIDSADYNGSAFMFGGKFQTSINFASFYIRTGTLNSMIEKDGEVLSSDLISPDETFLGGGITINFGDYFFKKGSVELCADYTRYNLGNSDVLIESSGIYLRIRLFYQNI